MLSRVGQLFRGVKPKSFEDQKDSTTLSSFAYYGLYNEASANDDLSFVKSIFARYDVKQ